MIKTTVSSQNQENKLYTVFLNEKGWHCTCPAFLFDKKKTNTCKHIKEVLEQLEKRSEN